MIEEGIKKEEYREIKPYWIKRLTDSSKNGDVCGFKKFDTVKFHYGYTNKTMTFECCGITIGRGATSLGAPKDKEVFIIKLGKRIEL